MTFQPLSIPGAFVVSAAPHRDGRGVFSRAWCREAFATHGIEANFVQANLADTREAGTVRGLHWQRAPHEELKLLRCVTGSIYDVIVDLRPASPTFRTWEGITLSAAARNAVVVPEGCAHGYQTLDDDTTVFYLVTAPYTPTHEAGLRPDDPALEIGWPLPLRNVSAKDRAWPLLEGVVSQG